MTVVNVPLALRKTAGTAYARHPWMYAPSVVLALLAAYAWQHHIVAGRINGLWGPYIIGVLGWAAAAAIAWNAFRHAPPSAKEHDVAPKDALFVAGIVGIFIMSLQMLIGIVADFGRSPMAHTPRFLVLNLVFAGVPLVAAEASRAALLHHLGRRHMTLAIVATTLLITALQFTLAQYQPEGVRAQTEFWGGAFIPVASTGLVAGFFVLYGGIWAGLLVSAPLVAFTYYSPILPVADWPILALAGVAGPAMGLWIAESMFGADEPATAAEPAGRFALPSISWVVTAVVGLLIFWSAFGFFGYLPSFVPSHSMEPSLTVGAMVVTKEVEADDLRVGDVVLYKMPNRQRVLHRLIAIESGEDGGRQFIFKGDNNNAADLYPVRDEQIIGRLVFDIPKLGWVPLKFQQGLGRLR
ncbi:MAG: signal peptidase I [Dehalococcoidia bacterium]|nr:signal peptidase I [Dehalococcoidia bacterium]